METICTSRHIRFLEMKCPTTHCFQAQGSNKKRLLLLLMFAQANIFCPAVFFYRFCWQNMNIHVEKIRLSVVYNWHNIWLKCSNNEKCVIVKSSLFLFRPEKKNNLVSPPSNGKKQSTAWGGYLQTQPLLWCETGEAGHWQLLSCIMNRTAPQSLPDGCSNTLSEFSIKARWAPKKKKNHSE